MDSTIASLYGFSACDSPMVSLILSSSILSAHLCLQAIQFHLSLWWSVEAEELPHSTTTALGSPSKIPSSSKRPTVASVEER